MKSKSRLKLAVIPLAVLGIISIFYIRESEKERAFITEYLRLYYSQLKISSQEKEMIENSMTSAAMNGEENIKYDLGKIVFYNKFRDFVSSDYLQFMLQNGEIPNYDLIEYGLKEHVRSFAIENVIYRKNISGANSISYDVLIKSADNRKKVLSFSQTAVIRKENGRMIIADIADDFGK